MPMDMKESSGGIGGGQNPFAHLVATPEERTRILAAGRPFDVDALLRNAVPATQEELADLDEFLRQREEMRRHNLRRSSEKQMRGYHDLGGLPGGPIEREEHEAALWEKRVHAMLNLLAEQGVITVDELRHGIETLGEAEYARLSYYERWIESIARALVQRGVVTTEELGGKMAR